MIVADASSVAGWLLNEPQYEAASDLFGRLLGETLFVPANWSAEVANALRKAWRTGRIREDEIVVLVRQLDAFDIVVEVPLPVTEIAALIRFAYQYGLSTYDAGYLRLALERGVPLATFDRSLRAAAVRVDVELLPPLSTP